MARKASQELKEKARELWLSGMTLDGVSAAIGVSRTTLSNWKSRGRWKDLDVTDSLDPVILANLYKRMNELTKDPYFSTKEVVDLKATIEYFSPKKLSIGTIALIMQDFGRFMAARDPALAKQVSKVQDEFINHKVGEHELK